MKTPQLVCCVMAFAVALAGCRGAGTQADASRTAKGVAAEVKGETKKVAAKAGDELADGWLTTKIQSKFVADREIKATDIDVSSREGVVTLKGRVQNEPMRSLAVAIARNTNQTKLSSDGLVKSADIQVTAKNGIILLEGTVPTSAAKQRALKVAREAEGVTQVVDRIRVGKRTK